MEKVPNPEEIALLIGKSLYAVWEAVNAKIDEKYDMEHHWDHGGKDWRYEYKYRRGGKTLCTLYISDNCLGILIIFGKAEREKFEFNRMHFAADIQNIYDTTKNYHDGKWMMFKPSDNSELDDIIRLLEIKRRPNRKKHSD